MRRSTAVLAALAGNVGVVFLTALPIAVWFTQVSPDSAVHVESLWILVDPPVVGGIVGTAAVITLFQTADAVVDVDPGGGPPVRDREGVRLADDDLQASTRRLFEQVDVPMSGVWVDENGPPNCYVDADVDGPGLVVGAPLVETLYDDQIEAAVAHGLVGARDHDTTTTRLLTAPLRTTVRALNLYYELVYLVVGFFLLMLLGVVLALVEGQSPGEFFEALWLGAPVFGFLLLVMAVFLGYLWVAKTLVERYSRRRTFAADRATARLTGDPGTVASALRAVESERPFSAEAPAVPVEWCGVQFVPPDVEDDTPVVRSADALRTASKTVKRGFLPSKSYVYVDPDVLVRQIADFHPPTEERIDRLQRGMPERSAAIAGD